MSLSLKRATFALFCIAATAVVMASYEVLYGNGPFRIAFTPEPDTTVVQFTYPAEHLQSPIFRVPKFVDDPFESELTSTETILPNATIEFADTTIMPGRFKIRVGDSLFDIMSSAINFNGVNYAWEADGDN